MCRWEERLRVRGGGRAREGQEERSKRSGEGLLEEVGPRNKADRERLIHGPREKDGRI